MTNDLTRQDELLFLALGGSGEIGMNVNLYGCEGKWLMVDLGMTFADPDYPGVDLVLPDLDFIEERRDDLLGIVLTHGHEDHIGAMPYLAADLGVPLYATPFTAGLIARQARGGGADRPGQAERRSRWTATFQLGPFGFRYVPLAHSIPEGNALLIETPLRPDLPHRRLEARRRAAARRPVDRGGADRDRRRGRARAGLRFDQRLQQEARRAPKPSVREGLDEVVAGAKGRVLVTTFASNAARLQTLGEVAQETGRQLCVAGRSLDRIIEVAQERPAISRISPTLIDFDDRDAAAARARCMIIATGGQGEPRAALGRIAVRPAPDQARPRATLVVFSSKQIPGNEIAIGRIQNELAAQGHRDGHRPAGACPRLGPSRAGPSSPRCTSWIRPEILVPVHGEMRHMAEQARFALAQGIPHGDRPEEWRHRPPRARAARRSSAKSGSGGWCSTATSSCPPTARR